MTESGIQTMIQEKRRVAFSSLLAAFLLTGLKLIVGFLTRSLGIIAEALHSGLDLVAALVTLLAVRVADKPADERHHYGHGKIESLSALIEAGLLFVTCGWIIYEAVRRIAGHGPEVLVNYWAIGVMVLSIIVDFSRSRALARVARKYSSQALEADALHFRTDIYSSCAVIIGLVLVKWFGFRLGDPLVALGVAIFVILSAIRLTLRALGVLLDQAQQGDVERVAAGVASAGDVAGYSNLRIRRAGSKSFVDLTIKVDPALPVTRAHEVSERVEQEIARRLPNSDVVVHIEPVDRKSVIALPTEFSESERSQLIAQIEQIINDHLPRFVNVHDVRAETNGSVPTITLHLVMPEGIKVGVAHEFCDHLENDLKERFANARIAIHVEPCDRNCPACRAECEFRR